MAFDLRDNLMHRPRISIVQCVRIDYLSPGEHLVRDLWSLASFEYYGAVDIDGRGCPLSPDYAFLLPPGLRRRYHLEGPCVHRVAQFYWAPTGEGPMFFDLGPLAVRMRHDFDELLAFHNAESDRADVRLWDMLWRLVDRPLISGQSATPTHPAVREALRIIQRRLAGELHVSELAGALGVSHNHLIRLFQRELGESPVQTIRRRRMEQASHLLRHSTLPIKVIAAQVGLADLQKFNRTAHRVWGCSPTQMRERSRTKSTRPRKAPR
jgi:AraC-like DNA-binding protein